jgi:hypothetical protein
MNRRDINPVNTKPMLKAVQHCQKIVDEYLHEALRQGVAKPENLYESYVNFGEDPFIQIHPDSQLKLFEGEHFSAWNYAKQRCEEYKQEITITNNRQLT